MNLLINDPPVELEVGGALYPVDAHYRNCLVIMSAFEDIELTPKERVFVMLDRLYVDIPDHTEEAVNAAVDFLNCGETLKNSGKRLYSFSHDSRYIRSAIEKSHRVDLQSVGFLHWWKFVYLFLDLDPDCFFNQLISLRQRRGNPKDLTKQERRYIAQNPEIVDLPPMQLPLSGYDADAADEFKRRYDAAAARRSGGE